MWHTSNSGNSHSSWFRSVIDVDLRQSYQCISHLNIQQSINDSGQRRIHSIVASNSRKRIDSNYFVESSWTWDMSSELSESAMQFNSFKLHCTCSGLYQIHHNSTNFLSQSRTCRRRVTRSIRFLTTVIGSFFNCINNSIANIDMNLLFECIALTAICCLSGNIRLQLL